MSGNSSVGVSSGKGLEDRPIFRWKAPDEVKIC